MAMYLFFVLKGFWNITHSSVLSMISAARENEYVRVPNAILSAKAVMGVLVLASGYYLANRINGKPVTETIGGKDYLVTETVRDAYVGYLQKQLARGV